MWRREPAISNSLCDLKQNRCPITDYSRLKYLSIDKRGDGIWAKIPFAGSKLLKKIPPAQGGKLAGQRRETFNF